ncbi:hypothetical protein AAL_05331 [Moelleriella libera RCEF 2490]|uniref:Uncharacterized protein n=1 Tax=Moelleriella libera RCEF 2490 TaxID=1081109 RepID=A0A168AU84_9HYPO|nr:hypothetical protein AAL_05331 [Moelleriella libera RCEF 2490]
MPGVVCAQSEPHAVSGPAPRNAMRCDAMLDPAALSPSVWSVVAEAAKWPVGWAGDDGEHPIKRQRRRRACAREGQRLPIAAQHLPSFRLR